MQHILYRRVSGGIKKRDALQKWWKGFLMGRIKQTFSFQLALKSLELCLQQPETLGLHKLNNQLILTPRLINSYPTVALYLNSISQNRYALRGAGARKHDAGKLGTIILQRKLIMTG